MMSPVGDAALAQGIVPPPVGGALGAPADDLLRETPRRLEPRLERPLGDDVEAATDALTEPVRETVQEVDETPQGALEDAGRTVHGTVNALGRAAQSAAHAAARPLRTFVEGVDPYGRAIEKDVLLVLVEPAQLAKLENSGLPIGVQRRLPSLGLVLVRIEGPPAPSLAEAAVDVRSRFPGAAVDYNFLYRPVGSNAADGGPVVAPEPDIAPAAPGPRVRIGLIDSAVSAEHPSLAGVRITARDFVPYEGERLLGHGTAVASIMATTARDDLEILAASVFFQQPGYAPGASTESLLAALDWLAGSDVDVINMSLAGPADELLERALGRLAGDGPTVVAAVGNKGPSGPPMYPAAYESVIGVTAIDRAQRIFAYANRGDHVAFAAPGVNVKVANSGGGWRLESGTSMASPYVAALIAEALQASELPATALIESLKADAEDLGEEGFDPVFGYGLVQRPPGQNAAASLSE